MIDKFLFWIGLRALRIFHRLRTYGDGWCVVYTLIKGLMQLLANFVLQFKPLGKPSHKITSTRLFKAYRIEFLKLFKRMVEKHIIKICFDRFLKIVSK